MNCIDFPVCGFDGNLIEKLSNSGSTVKLWKNRKTKEFFSGPGEAVTRKLLQILCSHLLEFEITCTVFIAYRQTLHFVSTAHHESQAAGN